MGASVLIRNCVASPAGVSPCASVVRAADGGGGLAVAGGGADTVADDDEAFGALGHKGSPDGG